MVFRRSGGRPKRDEACALLDAPSLRRVPTKSDISRVLRGMFRDAEVRGQRHIDVVASKLEQAADGNGGQEYRLPLCFDAMIEELWTDDEVLHWPPSVAAAELVIRFRLPRH
ncbi:hypothetical protein GCM10011534_11990 [Pseudooceanicola nanhaiensis]|uniref:Uncharacterized protein n=1 Tax=Pseudooceanicola nanhaiensis TaxID=375761 RepID=A0A917SP16_9RHOB|nr:hypothetical protein GCM10011534_11990 [Pseudooceanicola nanhaiensis]